MESMTGAVIVLGVAAIVWGIARIVSLFRRNNAEACQFEREVIKDLVEEKNEPAKTPQQIADFFNRPDPK
jgi:hypothetical protein